MRAFLSHSSIDRGIVAGVHDALEKESTWLDRAEIEWGDLFLERITEGLKAATDFVLFWSGAAAKSEWVRLEVNMAFIQALRQKAIRLRVVLLDGTPLPLYLQPFQAMSVVGSSDAVKSIVEKLSPILREPVRSARAKFVNRNEEIASIEDAVDDPELSAVWLYGFAGIGKASLVSEAIRRLFEGAESIKIEVNQGTGPVELALALASAARGQTLAESLSRRELERDIELSVETLAKDGRLLVLANVQHWLDEDAQPTGPLPLMLRLVARLSAFVQRPVFLTSTRRPNLKPDEVRRVRPIRVGDLSDEHVAVLVRNWYFSIFGKDLPLEDAKVIAPRLGGHPVAARLVAGLLGDHSANYLDTYPRELIALRRDLARILLQDLRLGSAAERLMEILALANVGLPASAIAGSGFSDDEFQRAVEECARAGLITADLRIDAHPLFRDFYWHRLHRSDYRQITRELAQALTKHLSGVAKDSAEYIELLPATFRLLAQAGDIEAARALRRDLSGELEATAVTLYNRRDYVLADKYVGQILSDDPQNWRMRLYRARIRIRQEEWTEADRILSTMLSERTGDVGVLHARGWGLLRQKKLPEALEIFVGIIARREHLASLRDAAECLFRMRRPAGALEFLARAKAVESENPFVLDLESRILEDLGELQPAFESAMLASARDPLNAHLHHRLGQIRVKQGRSRDAIPHFAKSIELDSDQFTPANSLASAYLDCGRIDAASEMLDGLVAKARTPSDRSLVEHTKARVAYCRDDLAGSEKILQREISASRNLVPNLGLLAWVQLAAFDKNFAQFPAIADVALEGAEKTLTRIVELEPSNRYIESIRSGIAERRGRERDASA